MEVLFVRWDEGFETEVVNNQQRDFDEGLESSFKGGGCSCCVELPQKLGLGSKDDIIAVSDCCVSQGLGDVAFSGATRSGDQDSHLFEYKVTGGQFVDVCMTIVRPLLSSNFAIIPQFLVLGRFFNQIWVEI